jgi:hypothetical protein
MASGPIEIDMALNASGVARGADDARQALRDLGDAVDDLGDNGRSMVLDDALEDTTDAAKDTERAVDRLGDAVDSNARSGEGDLDRLERSMRDVQDRTDDTARSVDDLGSVGDTSLRKLGDKGGEVAGELRQNLGETFASFRGDLEDLPQIAQDTLGGLAGSGALGGIPGLIATAAGAAGLGLLIGAFDTMNENVEAAKERTQEWADAFIEANGRVLEQTQIQSNIQSILTDTTGKLARAQQIAKLTGQELNDVVAGMADPYGAMGKVLSDEVNAALDDYSNKARAAADETGTANAEAMAQNSLLTTLRETWKAHTDEVGGGAESYDLYARAAGRARTANLEAAVAAGEATKRVDKFGDTVYTLPDGKKVYVDAETGKATEDLDEIKRRIYSVPDATVKVRVDSSEWDWYQPEPKVARIVVQGGLGTGRREVW